jgi:methyl-accepting chemotaxis protein
MMNSLVSAFDDLSQQSGEITAALNELQASSDDVKNNQANMIHLTEELEKTMFELT